MKGVGDDAVREAARELQPVCRDHGVPLLINDRPDLAAETGAEGVHIGQEDADYATARRLMGGGKIVGVTCGNSRKLAAAAAAAGADYVAFGAFYPTATKVPKTRAETELLRRWREQSDVPCVAIGGITPDNCSPLVAAGADYLATISAVWQHADGPAKAVRAFNRAIADALEQRAEARPGD